MTTDHPQHSTNRTPPWPRAADHSTHNPTVQQQRVSDLVKASADTLQRIGLQSRMRVLHMEQSNSGEAA